MHIASGSLQFGPTGERKTANLNVSGLTKYATRSVGSAPPRAQAHYKYEYEAIALPCVDIIRGTIGIRHPPTSVDPD